MITIDRIPQKLTTFFKPLRDHFSKPAWPHFWGLVLAIGLGVEHTLDRLNRRLYGHTHRTKDGEFLWQSSWDEFAVLRDIALDTLGRLYRTGEPLYLILDDTQTLKRAKKMQAVGKLYHHASGKYGTGHTILKACWHYRGVTIPIGSWLYVKKEHAKSLNIPFAKLTELAAEAIAGAPVLAGTKVTVLFDAYYLCPTVIQAVVARKWHYIGVAKSNRRFKTNGRWHRMSTYARNTLKRSGRWQKITGLKRTHSYCVTSRCGELKKLGCVKVVFSRRRGDRDGVALVTNDLARGARRVVADYLRRWSMELLIKDEKQHLGLGDYRVMRYRAVVRHLHLVDCAYACLTRVGLAAHDEQGQNKKSNGVLRLPSIGKLKSDLHRIVWRERVNDVVKVSHDRTVIKRLEKLLAA